LLFGALDKLHEYLSRLGSLLKHGRAGIRDRAQSTSMFQLAGSYGLCNPFIKRGEESAQLKI